MQDQFGNYAIQCCLGLGSDANLVLKVFYHNLLKIATTRFGCRALKNALETFALSPRTKRHLAKAIINNVFTLVTDPHGIILIHWLLDSNPTETRAQITSVLKGHFRELSFSKPTAAIISKLLSSQSLVVKDLIIAEIFSLDGIEAVLECPVASAVLNKCLAICDELDSRAKVVEKLAKLLEGNGDSKKDLKLHQKGLLLEVKKSKA
jgi:hypothetical protein